MSVTAIMPKFSIDAGKTYSVVVGQQGKGDKEMKGGRTFDDLAEYTRGR